MKKHTIGLIVLVILTLACLIALIIVLANSCRDNFTPPPPLSDTLFIWEDRQGTEISKLPDFNYSYANSITKYFNKVAFIAENKRYVDTTNTIWDDMTTKYSTSNPEYWLSIYFEKDGFFESCQSDPTKCQQDLDQYIKPYLTPTAKYKLTGIVIDKEGVRGAWPNISEWIKNSTTPNLEVIWGGSIHNCSQPPTPTITFSGCLGETYTLCDSHWSKLVNECKMDLNNFWKLVPQSNNTIPLVCMTGNCQEKPKPTAQGCKQCNDYRISKADLKQLVTTKPSGQNLGLWYGAGRMVGCPNSAKCSQQCCY